MTAALFISPHLDDAVLSCGGVIQTYSHARVVTVFAGEPEGDVPLTKFDVDSGFTSARQAVAERCHEDVRACTVLDARWHHLDHLDRQYGVTADLDRLTKELAELLDTHREDHVFVPLGIAHPDHEIVARHTRAMLVAHWPARVLAYEEAPARTLWPELARDAHEDWIQDATMTLTALRAGRPARKAAAVACYESQAWALDHHAVMVPERFWEVTR